MDFTAAANTSEIGKKKENHGLNASIAPVIGWDGLKI